jgi:hypothetical protein
MASLNQAQSCTSATSGELESARKHGVHDDGILHAYRYPKRVFDLDGIDFIVHAMTARNKFLR